MAGLGALCGSGTPCGRCVAGQASIELRGRADIVAARLAARQLAHAAGFGPLERARLVTALTEVGQNAVLYADGGVCRLADLSDARQLRLQVLVCDRGPGIPDIDRVLRDGYTLGGSLGGGLPGVRRMVDVFELQAPPVGTCITLQIVRPRLALDPAVPAVLAAPPPAARAAGPMAAPAPPAYEVVFARYMMAPDGPAGDLVREEALLCATELGMAMLASAPRVDQLNELHGRSQRALAAHWRRADASPAERTAHARLADGAAQALVLALKLPHEMAEQAHREQRWREQNARLAALYEQTDALILGLDADGHIESVNPAYTRATGWSPLQAATLAQAAWQGPLPTHATSHALLQQLRRDGSRFLVEWSITPIAGRDGQVRSHACIGRDVTRERQVEDGLRENDKLRAVATLAGGIAHDFNNLLGTIIGLTELCELQADAGSRLARNLGRIGQAGEKAAALVRKMLDFSRQTPPDLRAMTAGELLAHAEPLLRAALPSGIEMTVALLQDGPLCVDLVQMEQVLLNLTRNAAHAMRHHGGEIHVLAERAEPARAPDPESGAPAHLCLRVSDCGEGIAPDVLPKIFEPFYTTKPVGEGTGLGLAAVHGIVANHGGVIEVDSEPGAGTTFSVFLPLHD